MKSISANLDRAPALIGRILIAVIFIFSGLGKVATPDATIGYVTAVGVPAPLLGYIAATVLELAGGVLLVVGVFSNSGLSLERPGIGNAKRVDPL